jgi:hypothetical protein
VIFPLGVALLLFYLDWGVSALKRLSTDFVLATNQPLRQLLMDCADPEHLRSRRAPVLVTLATVGEVARDIQMAPVASCPRPAVPQPSPLPAKRSQSRIARWWRIHVTGEGSSASYTLGGDFAAIQATVPKQVCTIEYVPYYFDLRNVTPELFHDLILQSAGLPEIFPKRSFGDHSFVDGGIVDNEPLTTIAEREAIAYIVVIPLDNKQSESRVREKLAKNLVRVRGATGDTVELKGRFIPTVGTQALPPMLVLTPSRPLGSFLFGTLGFYARRSQALLRLGYCDTIRALANVPRAQIASVGAYSPSGDIH